MRASALVACLACLLAVPASAAGAEVFTGGTGWFWGNPLPQGEDLNAVAFAGGHGVAVGAAGAVLRTDDSGATWASGDSRTDTDLHEVALPDASTAYAAGGCVLRRSDDGGATWKRVAFSVRETKCPSSISPIAFPTPSLGYVFLGNGTVLRTTNGGASFSRRSSLQIGSSVPQGGPKEAVFLSPTLGVVATGIGSPAFVRTEDGGQTWTAIRPAGFGDLGGFQGMLDVDFVNASLGYAVGSDFTTRMAKTEDGGKTWTPVPLTGASGFPRAISCASPTACAIVAGHDVTGAGDLVTWTADGGATGTTIQPGANLAALDFASPTRVIGVGAAGATLASNDAAHTFGRVGGAAPGDFAGLRQTGGQALMAWAHDGALARSANGGATWQSVGLAPINRVIDVSFADDSVGYLLSADGALQRTDDGGASWAVVPAVVTGPRGLLATAPGTLLVATRVGLLRSTDSGATFAPVGAGLGSPRAFDSGGFTLFAYGPKTLLASRDGGVTWRKLRRPPGGLLSVDFVSTRIGFAVNSRSDVFKTTTAGRSWKLLPGVGRDDVVQVSFGDSQHGFLLIGTGSDLGGVLRTSDGGRSWRPQVLTKRPLIAVKALGAVGGAALSEGLGHLFATTTGGDAGARPALKIRVVARKRVRKGAVVTIAGRLKPAPAGAGVAVTARIGGDWIRKFAKVSHGRFKTTWHLRHATVFVAQFRGGAGVRSAGTPALAVTLGRRGR